MFSLLVNLIRVKNIALIIVIIIVFVFSANVIAANKQMPAHANKVSIVGVSKEIRENIALHLQLEGTRIPLSPLGFPRSDKYIVEKTKEALRALGYYQPNVSILDDSNEKKILVELGSPIRWRHIDFNYENTCRQDNRLMSIIDNLAIKSGDILHHGDYATRKNEIHSQARALGFLDSTFEQSQFFIEQTAGSADLKWQFNCGAQYQLLTPKFSGSTLSPELLSGLVRFKPGEVYNQNQIIEYQQALVRSGYFNNVDIVQNINKEDHTVQLEFVLVDKTRYEVKFEAGYGTDTRGKLGFAWKDQLYNELGHFYQLTMDLNQLSQNYAFIYTIPNAWAGFDWSTRLSFHKENEEYGSTSTTSIDSSWFKQFTPHWSNRFVITLASEVIRTDTQIVSGLEYLVPSWHLSYNSSAKPYAAVEGWRWQSKLRGSSSLLSDPDLRFFQTEQHVKWIDRLSPKWRLMLRGRVGITLMNTDDFTTFMPSDYRFFTGGDVTVRGYNYQSLAPKDEDGVLLGGKHLTVASAEIDYLFKEDMRWALFTDHGNAFNDWQSPKLKSSVGVGFRWVTPVGSIRVDIAKAFNEEREWRLHLTIGPDL